MPAAIASCGLAKWQSSPSIAIVAAVGAMHAAEDADQGRLAGAVLADQRVDLAEGDVEIDVVERERRAELLADRLGACGRMTHALPSPPSFRGAAKAASPESDNHGRSRIDEVGASLKGLWLWIPALASLGRNDGESAIERQRGTKATCIFSSVNLPRSMITSLSSATVQSRIGTS